MEESASSYPTRHLTRAPHASTGQCSRVKVGIGVFSFVLVLFASLSAVRDAAAQVSGQMLEEVQNVGVDEKLGSTVPAEIVLRDESGTPVRLGSFFDEERPVLLNFVYHNCPMLCDLVLDGVIEAVSRMAWTPGNQFDILTVSFNPAEGPELAAAAKQRAINRLGKVQAGQGWHFLTGDREAIHALTDAVGFRYEWVEAQQEFAHPSVITFLSGTGTVSRYLYGVRYDPRDMRTALVEASNGKVGSAMDQVLLYCFQYDPARNAYVLHAMNLMKIGGLLTVVILGSILVTYWRRESLRSRNDWSDNLVSSV